MRLRVCRYLRCLHLNNNVPTSLGPNKKSRLQKCCLTDVGSISFVSISTFEWTSESVEVLILVRYTYCLLTYVMWAEFSLIFLLFKSTYYTSSAFRILKGTVGFKQWNLSLPWKKMIFVGLYVIIIPTLLRIGLVIFIIHCEQSEMFGANRVHTFFIHLLISNSIQLHLGTSIGNRVQSYIFLHPNSFRRVIANWPTRFHYWV